MTKARNKKTECDAILETEIAIVGGGLAGLTLSCLLGVNGVSCVCVDRDDPKTALLDAYDGRTTAISLGSRRVLEHAGVWQDLEPYACPISDIRILDSDSPVLLDFVARDAGEEAFGWILENRLIRRALYEKISTFNTVHYFAPATVNNLETGQEKTLIRLEDGRSIQARLLVGADGRQSFVREHAAIGVRNWSYRQQAIVCVARHENPHDNIAIEHFRPEGPFAVLPMRDDEKGVHRSSVVWTEHRSGKRSAMHFDQQSFNAALNARFPDFYGKVEQDGPRFSYPLSLVHAYRYTAPRTALIADAAHGIHPIAGQGLNLGFRDIECLSNLIVQAVQAGHDPGGDTLLQRYEQSRKLDNASMAGATDILNRLFSNNVAPVRLLRKMGLHAVSRTGPVKRFFMRQAMGLGVR